MSPLYCSACGTEVPGRPPGPSYAVCPGCACILRVDAPATDVFGIKVSDIAAPTPVLQAAQRVRAVLRAQGAGR